MGCIVDGIEQHEWRETGRRDNHVGGEIFKYGTTVVTYVRCARCRQDGFRREHSEIVFTWRE